MIWQSVSLFLTRPIPFAFQFAFSLSILWLLRTMIITFIASLVGKMFFLDYPNFLRIRTAQEKIEFNLFG